jgi:excisionase family DNA binding protein
MGNSELMNTKEAAAYLGVTIYWLQTHWRSERIPAVRLTNRGRLHFRKSALDGWVKTREVIGEDRHFGSFRPSPRSKSSKVKLA